MTLDEPEFMPYVIITENGWKLQDNAPPEAVEEFEEFMSELELSVPRE